jgi:phosphopantothenoylcysteine decarboxylase/phosphopantothenate--cysteine ligase
MLPEHLKFRVLGPKRIHLGVTGSIAAYKALDLLRDLLSLDLTVSVTLTAAAAKFVTPLSFTALGASQVYDSLWAPGEQGTFGHLEPTQAAACLVVAPATANIMAKLAHGLADEMLSTQALGFTGPIVLAPAMNPRLYSAAPTRENEATLRRRGVVVVDPDEGPVACGDTGKGRLAELWAITSEALRAVAPKDMAGRRVLVNLGPTQEYFDPARYWSNPSTGLMGQAMAMAAWLRGAEVTVVHGPVSVCLPASIKCQSVTTAREMSDCCQDLWPSQDMGFMAAAVADFSPKPYGPDKFKKTSMSTPELSLKFTANPDILKAMGQAKRPGQTLLGFCAETGHLLEEAKAKLTRKNCDLMVANSISALGSGFASPTNAVVVCDNRGRVEEWPLLPKCEVAWRLCEWICHLLA